MRASCGRTELYPGCTGKSGMNAFFFSREQLQRGLDGARSVASWKSLR